MQTGKVDFCPKCPGVKAPKPLGVYFKETVHFDNYKKNGGNVSRLRVESIKNRCLAPEGKGEVVMKTKFGKITDKQAVV